MKVIRAILLFLLAFTLPAYGQHTSNLKRLLQKQRLFIIMFDGFGMSYYNQTNLPNIKALAKDGFYKQVLALMPTVTNENNASICTGQPPDKTGIIGNSYLTNDGKEEFMEDQHLLLCPTLFEILSKESIPSALIASKKKSIGLLSAKTSIALSPEIADSMWLQRLGTPPSIYSPEVNFWSFNAAVYILKNMPNIRCVYLHTTDYPMHMWAPGDTNSIKHLQRIDDMIGQIKSLAPDAMILLTADHDVNHKNKCIDIEKLLSEKNTKIKMAISAERDKYYKHHRGFGGTSYVYLNNLNDIEKVKTILNNTPGVDAVLTRNEASKKYQLMEERIGDLVVLGDSLTVFGNLENTSLESLPANYRSHGSTFERDVPMIIYNVNNLPDASFFKFNYQITSWLFKN